ncbi:hypothetical protein GW835_02115 [archaeon]|nr:hypothetical protein [archaeon]NCP79341.1 hypothetical protein [archaeon]NCP97284.1 hypothetical protein [archaeon]NCQ07108.1 hypothetical protein [archaeon]NCQ50904.1 hypothetical protein [archaeon]
MFIKNNKGQAFEAYQLLIAFIIATAILGIIVMMISKTNSQAIIISNQKIEDAFTSAINSPVISMEKPFVVKDVLITGILSYERYEQISGIEEGCFGFIVGPGVTLQPYGVIVDKKYLKTNVYFSCGLRNMSGLPDEIYPGVSGNRPFQDDPSRECERLFCVMYINKTPEVLN